MPSTTCGGCSATPTLAPLLARHGLPAVVMHNQRDRAFGGDVIADIRAGPAREHRRRRTSWRRYAGQLIVDPGFGFGWEPAQNLEMLRRLGELRDLGRPLLVGVSRKSTLGLVLDKPEEERAWGTAAAVALCVQAGADIVRVHDVAEMVDVVKNRRRGNVRPGSQPREHGEATAYLGLGSNLGDRVANLASALDALERAGLAVDAVSSIYDTPPWGEPPPGLDGAAALRQRRRGRSRRPRTGRPAATVQGHRGGGRPRLACARATRRACSTSTCCSSATWS